MWMPADYDCAAIGVDEHGYAFVTFTWENSSIIALQ